MPVQTQLQIRRDTAANWSSTNPTLASGEWGLETDTRQYKIGDGVTAWNSLGYQLGPLLDQSIATDPNGAYFTGSDLRLNGVSGNSVSTPDSAALDITSDIDIRVKIAMDDWTPSGTMSLVNKGVYSFFVRSSGVLGLYWEAGGGSVIVDSTVATGLSDNSTKWIRVTLDVNNGASGRDIKFFTSDDGTTWTQLGNTITQAGTTLINVGTAALQIGSQAGTGEFFKGTFYRAQVLNGIGGTTVFDANFETVPADSFAFTESSANAATVTLTTTRYSFGLPGATLTGTGTLAYSPALDTYNPFKVTGKPITIKQIAFEVTSTPVSNSTFYIGIYNADAQMQPTGNALYVSSAITVLSAATAIYRIRVTPFTLPPGNYLIAHNMSVGFTLRSFISGSVAVVNTLGTSTRDNYRIARANAAFTNSPSKWNISSGQNGGARNTLLLGWS